MRKRQAKKRPLLPDPKFNDQLVTRFVNMMMWDGKKSVAFRVFYDAIDIVEEKNTDEETTALQIWKNALTNVIHTSKYVAVVLEVLHSKFQCKFVQIEKYLQP